MILMRGAPGSGKSYLAKQLLDSARQDGQTGIIISTDDYFMKDGVYVHDVSKLREAHSFTQSRCRELCNLKVSPIIIDNTNIKKWEMAPYLEMAKKFSYHVEYAEPQTEWWMEKNVDEMAKRNTHDVPREVIQRMVDSFEMLPQFTHKTDA
jgi:predicted kinase